MLKFPYSFSVTKRTQTVIQSLVLSSFTAFCLLGGTVVSGVKANAQNPTVNATELTNYAKIILAMEPARQQAFDEIKKIVGNSEVPKIVCNDSNSFNGLPGKAKDIAVNYCKSSQKIVEDNGLSIERFNKITSEVQGNEGLKKMIFDELMKLQKKPE
jgi:glutaredoxin